MLMWLGKLDKNGVVTIDGSQASPVRYRNCPALVTLEPT
jgi:hypothetical protein